MSSTAQSLAKQPSLSTAVSEPGRLGVLLVGNFISKTVGVRGVCEDLAEQLRATGRAPILTTSEKAARLPRLFDMVQTIWQQRNRYSIAQVDVYSGAAFGLAEVVCQLLRLAGKPYVLTLHGGNLPNFSRRWPRRVRRLLGSAVLVTTPSHYLRETMKAYHSNLRLLPNPLDLRAYHFKLRRELKPHLIWLRSFHRTYNPTLAPRVVALLAKQFPETHLTMIGPDRGDGTRQASQEVARSLAVHHRVEFPGGVAKAEVPQWLNKGDVFINTTNVDNTPVSVIEAMACGLCVVSTNVGGIPFLLRHEEDALLVPPDDPPAMAEAVRRFLTDSDLAAACSEAGRRKALQFDWAIILPQWERILFGRMPAPSQTAPKRD